MTTFKVLTLDTGLTCGPMCDWYESDFSFNFLNFTQTTVQIEFPFFGGLWWPQSETWNPVFHCCEWTGYWDVWQAPYLIPDKDLYTHQYGNNATQELVNTPGTIFNLHPNSTIAIVGEEHSSFPKGNWIVAQTTMFSVNGHTPKIDFGGSYSFVGPNQQYVNILGDNVFSVIVDTQYSNMVRSADMEIWVNGAGGARAADNITFQFTPLGFYPSATYVVSEPGTGVLLAFGLLAGVVTLLTGVALQKFARRERSAGALSGDAIGVG